MAPENLEMPSLFFAHNVETEIFERHAGLTNGFMKAIWRAEAAKMARFENKACQRVDGIIAVSDRDAALFQSKFAAENVFSVPTGVDLDFFKWRKPKQDQVPTLIFTGSLDWRANQDGLSWFMDEVLSLIHI